MKKHYMKNNWWLLALMAFFSSSCEKKVDIDLPKQTSKLGIHAIWDRDSVLTVVVTRSFSITETPQLDYSMHTPTISEKLEKYSVPNAKVEVLKDGVLYDELVFDAQKYIYKSPTGKTATPDAGYTIKAAATGFADVSAPVIKFPGEVTIKSVQVKKNVTSSSSTGGLQDEIAVEFDDPAATKNFYWLKIAYNKTPVENYYSPIYIYPVDQDIIVPAGFDISTSLNSIDGNYIILKDDSFNGGTKRLSIRIPSWILNNSNMPLAVSLNNASEGLFNYLRSRVLTLENPFSTPTQAYSNITNGLGIFGLYTSDKKVIQ